jgi:hypothetical protein
MPRPHLLLLRGFRQLGQGSSRSSSSSSSNNSSSSSYAAAGPALVLCSPLVGNTSDVVGGSGWGSIITPSAHSAALHTRSSVCSTASAGSSEASTSGGSPSKLRALRHADLVSAALKSVDGAARLSTPRSADVRDALKRASALRLLQRHYNINVPGLRGQAVLARVVRSGGASSGVLLDPGYYGLSAIGAHELGALQLYTPAGQPLPPRSDASPSRAQLRRGNFLRLRLGPLFTPYGDVQLEPVRVRPEVRRKLVWGELGACMMRGSPVWGRVLNPCAGGYAVGVAGYVALLPSRQASIHNIQNIGTLQQFYIHRMVERGRRIELSNYADDAAAAAVAVTDGGSISREDGADPSLWSNL